MKGLMRLIVSFFVLVVDGLYGDRPYARFYALETIVHQIVEQGGDYVLPVKGNQGNLHWVLTNIDAIPALKQWAGSTAIGCTESQRTVALKTTTEKRYFLMSLPLSTQQVAEVVRGHWGIENQLHWVLDVAFREDGSKVAQGYAPENLAVLRHIALNLISQEKSLKAGTRAKRMRAGWDDQYLFRILANYAQTHTKP